MDLTVDTSVSDVSSDELCKHNENVKGLIKIEIKALFVMLQ